LKHLPKTAISTYLLYFLAIFEFHFHVLFLSKIFLTRNLLSVFYCFATLAKALSDNITCRQPYPSAPTLFFGTLDLSFLAYIDIRSNYLEFTKAFQFSYLFNHNYFALEPYIKKIYLRFLFLQRYFSPLCLEVMMQMEG